MMKSGTKQPGIQIGTALVEGGTIRVRVGIGIAAAAAAAAE